MMTRAAFARQWVAIGRAMAEQVDRVNDKPAAGPDPEITAQIRALRAENAALLDRLADAQALIDDLKAQMDDAPRRPRATVRAGLLDPASGRPVGTQSDFARVHKVGAWQVSRWISAGKLATTGKYVYLDQPLPSRKAR
jgi:hypothetical protein